MNRSVRLVTIFVILSVSVLVVVSTYQLGPPWAQMLVTAFAVFFLLRWITWNSYVTSKRKNSKDVSSRELLAYFLLWPGFDVAEFREDSHSPPPSRAEWRIAFLKAALAALIVWGGVPLVARLLPPGNELLLGWAGMFALILLLHCSLFHLAALAWQTQGRAARPIMNSPLRAKSLAEFWGRRWNLAFRDAAHVLVYRPLARSLGPRLAMLAVFLFSGVVHDIVISLPARGGWGLPTLYFMFQAGALLVERSRWGRAIGLGRGFTGWTFTALVLALPLPLLFHRPFTHRVMVPLLQVIGAT